MTLAPLPPLLSPVPPFLAMEERRQQRRGANLVSNGGFEVNTTGWQTDGVNVIARSSDQAFTGSFSLKATKKAGGDRYRLAEYPITLTAALHTISAWIWLPAAYAGLDMHIRSSNFAGSSEVIGHADMDKRDQWQRVIMRLTPVGGDLSGELRFSEDNGAIADDDFIYIDAVKVELGLYATPYVE